jgi:hypothetical protein
MFPKPMKKLSENELKAKMSVLEDLKSQAEDKMKEPLKNLKKVSIMSDSKEGLKQGLEKAEEMMESGEESPMVEAEEDSEEGEEYHLSDEDKMKFEAMSEDELQACINELEMIKQKKMKGEE